MRYQEVSKILGKLLFYFTILLLLPLFISLYYQYFSSSIKPASTIAFIETIFISLTLSGIFLYFGRNAKGIFFRRESVLIVIMMWILTTFVGSLPFFFSKTLTNPIDCIFESMSGLTTTGATIICPKKYAQDGKTEIAYIIKNTHFPSKYYKFFGNITPIKDKKGKVLYEGVEAVSEAILFWRSFIQWLGGLGIVLLFLTVLPALAVGGKFLLQAEMTGPIKDTIAPRIKETASLLWKLYLGLTIIEVIILLFTNTKMEILDAFCITFSNLSTGGFSIKNDSIAGYNNHITEWVVIVFMFLGSINFTYYFYCLRAKFYKIYEPDFFLYIFIVIIGSMLVVYFLSGSRTFSIDGKAGEVFTFEQTLREGTFHAISAQSSTGFVLSDVTKWPFKTQIIMLILMYFGGMSGSTSGGIKTSRFYILYKILKNKIEEIFRPTTVRPLKIKEKEIPQSTAITVLAFFCIVGFFSILGVVLLIFDHIDSETAISTVACMLNNVGFAFGVANPSTSFAFLGDASKLLSSFLMFLGRLEYYIIMLVFFPGFWKVR
jgi:trk system potassium uptake protein